MSHMDFKADNTPNEIAPGPGKKTSRKRWKLALRISCGLVVAVVLLVLAVPTLLSTGPGLAIVLGQVNKNLNGKVAVQSASLGWFGGVELTGVRVTDAQGTQIAEVDHLVIPFPLWRALSGKFSLGNVTIDGLAIDAKYDAQGNLNFSQLAKARAEAAPAPAHSGSASSKESKLPQISGNIKLTNCRATISYAQPGKATLYVRKLDGEIKIPDINQPISDDLTVVVKVDDHPEGTLAVKGTAAVISNGQVAMDVANVHQTLDAKDLDLQSVKAFLPSGKGIDTLDGTIGFHIAADLTAGKAAGLDAWLIASKPVAFGGEILKGDTFKTNSLDVQLPKLTASFPNGLSEWQSSQLKLGSDAAPVLVKIDQGQLTINGELSPQAILNLIDRKNPESTGQLVVASNFDLSKIIPQLKHLVPTVPGTTIQSGGFSQKLTLAMTADKAVLSNQTDTTRIAGVQTGNRSIAIEPIHTLVTATDLGGGGALPDLHAMSVKIHSDAANGEFQGDSLVNLNGAMTLNLDLLRQEISQFVDLSGKSFGGTVEIKLTQDGDLGRAPYKSAARASVVAKSLTYSDASGPRVHESLVDLELVADVQGSVQSPVEQVKNLSATLKRGDAASPPIASVLLPSATISLAEKSVLNQVRSAHWQVDVPDLKPVMELADSFSPAVPAPPVPAPAAKADPSAPKPIPPLKITSGAIALSGDLSHEGSTLKISVNQASVNNVVLQHGTIRYAAKPINANLQMAIATQDGKTVMQQIRQLQVSQLTGDLGIATLSMPTPIVVSGLDANLVANGSIKVSGDLSDLMHLLDAIEVGEPDAYPYQGTYTLAENIGSQNNSIALKGGLQIAKFQAMDGNAVKFAEDMVSVNNDLLLSAAGEQSLTINELSATMQSSGALKLMLKNGSITSLTKSRILQLQPALAYDWAKLWPVVQPIMGDKYKTLKIAGVFEKQFNITGSYPANKPFTEAIKTVHADGDLAVTLFDYDGLTVQNFILPFAVDSGKLVTVYAGKPAGQNTAPPATANGGPMDLGNLTIDLTQDPPRLSTPANKVLLTKVSVNPLLAQTILKSLLGNPLLSGAKQESGLLDLTMVACVNLPLGGMVTEAVPANAGKADLKFQLVNLRLSFEGIKELGSALKMNLLTADIRDGTVSISSGVSTQHMSFVSNLFSLDFDGKVRLADEAFVPMELSMGPLSGVFQHAVDSNVLKFFPDRASLPVEGTVSSPVVRVDKLFGKLFTDAAGKAAGGLLGGNKDGNNKDSGNNPVDGLLKGLGIKKK